jgi:hydrogenase maturation protease
MRTLVIGLGNAVRSDDSAGLVVARALRERLADAPDVDVVEMWHGGLQLAEAMSGYDRAVVVDAMATGAAPGTVRRLDPGELGAARNVTSTHDTSLPLALELWRRVGLPVPADLSVWGIEAADLDTLGEELTGPVAAAVPRAVSAILDDLCLAQGDRA